MSKKTLSAVLIFSLGGLAVAAVAKPEHTPLRWSRRATQTPPSNKAEYFEWLGPMARDVQRRTGIPASITLSQSWREARAGDGSGLSFLALPPNRNIYGIKAGTCGLELASGTVRAGTWEDDNGNGIRDPDEGRGALFATFDNYYAATLAHGRLMYCVGAYAPALAHRADAFKFIMTMGPIYATDASYSAAVWADVIAYDLRRFDLPPDEWSLDPGLVPERHIATWAAAVEARA